MFQELRRGTKYRYWYRKCGETGSDGKEEMLKWSTVCLLLGWDTSAQPTAEKAGKQGLETRKSIARATKRSRRNPRILYYVFRLLFFTG